MTKICMLIYEKSRVISRKLHIVFRERYALFRNSLAFVSVITRKI